MSAAASPTYMALAGVTFQLVSSRPIASALTTPLGDPVSTASKASSTPKWRSDINAVVRDFPVTSPVRIRRSLRSFSAETSSGTIAAHVGKSRSYSAK